MKNILNAPFITDMCNMADNIYRLGWAERNGGNISMLLEDVGDYIDIQRVIRTIPTGFDASSLAGKIFLVTGTGVYFKNISGDPEKGLGIIRISKDGTGAELLWGYSGGGRFTSELPAHLMSHITRLSIDPEHRVVLHTHPTYTIAMSTLIAPDEGEITRSLWQINTECIVVFPEGVGVLPWMVCGTNEIGEATAEKMKKHRIVLWTNHGIYGTGSSLDEAFGLVETVEKTAQIYMLTQGFERKNLISNAQLLALAKQFGVQPGQGIL